MEFNFKFIADADFWLAEGRRELEVAKARALALGQRELRRPKNVVLFVGDGMGLNTVTAARIYKGQSRQGVSGEEASLAWETFPSMGLLKVRPMFIEPANNQCCWCGRPGIRDITSPFKCYAIIDAIQVVTEGKFIESKVIRGVGGCASGLKK